MPSGPVVHRELVFLLRDGRPVIDWGGGVFQDIWSGDFIQCQENEISHIIPDESLEMLMDAKRVEHYDNVMVYLYALPELPRNTLS